MNNMEIKQGDKVRVSKDAPLLYTEGRIDWEAAESTVGRIDGDAAEIDNINEDDDELYSIVIPVKYLVKVDAEEKEAKYHKDDKVCINKSSLKHGLRGEILTIIGVDVSDRTYYVQSSCMRSPIWLREDEISPYTEPTAPKFKVGDRVKFKNIYELQKVKDKSFRWMLVMFASKEATITAVEDNGFYRVDIDPSIGGINDDMIEYKVEPKEQTEAKKKPYDGLSEETANEISDMLEAYAKALSGIADPFDWQRYEADLAKEIVLKTVNSASDQRPMAIAEYATDVAKAVVEGLKRE